MDAAFRQDRLAELSGANQPSLEPGTLSTLDVGPEIVSHHSEALWRRAQASDCGLKELAAGVAGHPGSLPARILQAGDKGPGTHRRAPLVRPIPISGEGDQCGAIHAIVERLLHQTIIP